MRWPDPALTRIFSTMSSPSRARHWYRRTAIGVVMLAVLFALGPRTSASEPDVAAVGRLVPDDVAALSEWLAGHERTAGATDTFTAARIRFFDDTVRTRYAVLHMHGFTGTRQESAPLADSVAARLGANLFDARLAGHGMTPDSMRTAGATTWMTDAVRALAAASQLGDSVVIVGASTGGTLASWLAAHPLLTRSPIAAVVLISPNFGVAGPIPTVLRLPWTRVIVPRFMPRFVLDDQPAPNSDFERMAYSWTPVSSLFHMIALVDHVSGMPLDHYRARTLLIQNRSDPVVDVSQVEAWMARLRGRGVQTHDMWVTVADGENPHVLASGRTAASQLVPVTTRIEAFVRVQ